MDSYPTHGMPAAADPDLATQGVSIPEKSPEISSAVNQSAYPPLLDILDNEETIAKARRVLDIKLTQFKDDRDDLEDGWEDSDMMWSCGVDDTRREAAQNDDTEADCGSTLFYRQVRTLASLDVDVVLGKPDESPVRYTPTHIDNIPFSEEDSRAIAAQRQALLRYTMKVDSWVKKFIEGDFMLTKYSNQPVMLWWRRRVDERWFKNPKTDETGKITGFDWNRRDVVVEDHPELVFPPNENFYIDRHISDLQRQQAIFFEELQDITEIWGGAAAGDYSDVDKIKENHQYGGESDSDKSSEQHEAHEENRGLSTGNDAETGLFKTIHCWGKLPIDKDGKWDEKGTAPRWFFFTFIDNIATGPCIRAKENPDPDNEFPGLMWHRNPDDADLAYHIADSTILKPNWDETTTRKNQYFDNLTTINRRPILNERGNANTNDLIYGAGRIINVERIDGTKEMDVRDTSQSFLQCLEYIDNDSNRAIGTDAPITGQALGSRTSASEANNINAAATRPHNVLIRYHLEQLLPWYARKIQRYWELYGDPDRTLAITDQGEMIRVDLGRIFGEFDIEVTIIQDYQKDLVSDQNLAFVMQAVIPNFLDVMGMEGKQALLAKILDHYNVDIEEALPEFDNVEAKMIALQRLSAMLDTGDFEEPQQGENLRAHMAVAQGFLLKYQGVEDPEIIARLGLVQDYIAMLEQLMSSGAGGVQGGSLAQPSGNETSGEVTGNAIAGSSPASVVGNLPMA